jgi:hypothetical protein
MTALTTFGTNGWLAPGTTSPYVTTGSTERGLAFGNGHLYLVSRANVGGNAVNVRILNPTTGSDLGALNTTGVAGGTFPVNAVATGSDGAIYVGNLVTTAGANYIVYKWANEAATPTQAINTTFTQARVGDDLTALGGGSSTLLAAGFGTADNGFAVLNPTTATATAVAVTGAALGDYSIGLTFRDSGHLYGSRGSPGIRNTSFSGTTGNVDNTFVPSSVNQRLLAYAVVGGTPLLAVENSATSATDALASTVYLYDATDPTNPQLITSLKNTTGALFGSTGNGALAWDITGPNTANLYALVTNEGIQAFTVTVGAVPEPSTLALAGVGLGGLLLRRLRRKA